ncbi:leucine-rich repeat domain-containing protein [uncultured Holdemanella sp.]|uniref:leucine-rich repeat domain-containing protein n=1 Tax=uncultured Holdemanella sp. TaxID=1763549 RepID=UPI0025E9F565|nr:leucine-rich repeat domain-containing protein [uncultured Holdemanella sp.]
MEICVYYEKINEDSIRINKVYSSSSTIEIPELIDGYIVREIGNYCFSKKEVDLSNSILSHEIRSSYHECSGSDVESVRLSKTLTKIGDYAFYNCRMLKEVFLPSSLMSIGSDAFMNCLRLNHIHYGCSIFSVTILKQILTQITWDIEVDFIDGSIFYPEYNGSYDEVGPAHIFALNIEGEGFRMRQCFKDGKIDFDGYDACFEKLCAEESESCIFHVAILRFMMGSERYIPYLKAHDLTSYLHTYKDICVMVEKLLEKECLNQSDLDVLISMEKNLETRTLLMELKNKMVTSSSTYSFEDF